MDDMETARFLGRHLIDRVLPVFIRGVARIPQADLGFRPTPENMSAKELAYHVPQVAFLLTQAVRTGRVNTDDLRLLGWNPEEAQTPEALVSYAEEASRHVAEVIDRLSEADVNRRIERGPRDTSLALLMLALEEAIHHRGQLSTYLRLMGVKPPGLYDY